MARDAVDLILEQWAEARPDLDASPMGVIGRLSRASRTADVELQRVFSEFGLQRGEFDIMATLRRAGPPSGMTAGALARSAMVTSGAITNRIDRLIAKDYVTRDVDPANRRTVLIALTPAGRTLIDKAVAVHVDNEHRILAGLSGRQQKELATLLRALIVSLDDAPPLAEPGDTAG
ncbi:MarR family winged helix-turn-helix transcriptional regulator [Luteipulveratus mongoliensis]|uniref:MarR family transcriptional regulator n=1 Tax=Luteipulveratus mongoliensis TaxID=571913 RepID=A0A0K1JET8_9MICO|nr:MarR family transcriptional regulator [Luteipulveratus mongoliensis]AKU15211.1 MarR family transcriptional regulator [Luteipulveratus mongoliensis]